MGSIRFSSLTFLAKTGLACGLDCDGWSVSVRKRLVSRKVRIACLATRFERGAGIGEDGGRV